MEDVEAAAVTSLLDTLGEYVWRNRNGETMSALSGGVYHRLENGTVISVDSEEFNDLWQKKFAWNEEDEKWTPKKV